MAHVGGEMRRELRITDGKRSHNFTLLAIARYICIYMYAICKSEVCSRVRRANISLADGGKYRGKGAREILGFYFEVFKKKKKNQSTSNSTILFLYVQISFY